ncbi:MAG TPA: hypothetical protein VMF62_12345 [Acetobacteraceae bacterium]|nr:hypothetical protein [Acetobacteraceae bacterium]
MSEANTSPFAGVVAAVDFYSFENKSINLLASAGASQVLSLSVTNTLLSGGGGFSMTLAPGGPSGIAGVQYSEIIKPMALCVIALGRGANQAVCHVGLVNTISEEQTWGDNVTRTITVSGYDLASYYLYQFNFASLAFLAGNVAAGASSGLVGNASSGPLLNAGLPGYISPAQFAERFWLGVMLVSGGLLGRTVVPYQGTRYPLSQVITARFDEFNAAETLPYADAYYSTDGPFIDKFTEALAFPVYENFCTTAPEGMFAQPQANAGYFIPGMQFTSTLLPYATPAGPCFINRLNPQPNVTLTSTAPFSGQAAVSTVSQSNPLPPYIFSGVDYSQWIPLTTFKLANYGFIDSQITFSPNNNYNFYMLNSLGLTAYWANQNSNVNPIQLYDFSMLCDIGSVQRFGYLPFSLWNGWYCNFDPNNQPGLSNDAFETLVALVMMRCASYFEVLPYCGNASVTCELRPDIVPGNLFEWAPYRSSIDTWTAYINTVTHTYTFGGPSTTTLTLERALPSSVYADAPLLLAIMTGNAQVVNGVFTSGLPDGIGPGLVGYSVANQTQLQSLIAAAYLQSQYK